MIPDSLRQLLDATQGQREAEWQGRRVLLFNTAWGELAVSLQGAQVLHYLPFAPDTERATGTQPAPSKEDGWLWVTPTPQALPGTIRGGIPVCWPWFADESPDGRGPKHGTARQAEWRLDGVDDEDEGVEVHLSPTARLDEQLTPRVMIHASAQRLHVELVTEHRGETPVKLTAALHSYLSVAHTHQCRVEGLAGARYLDKRQDFSEAHQQGELGVRGPLDRIYESNRPLVLDDGARRLQIAKQGSDSTVVWHPDTELPGDTPADVGYRFLCVEAACTRVDPVWLVPGAQHLLATTLTREDMTQ
ncbi:D-hexose-6-phosphate mutarotase [Chromohalobacter sp. TMW 2.2308]|uniref:D-hexose-6-phosphate mutarotase n=1 Tax=Chromohalobacter TaxID=42054 RepID=UPI001FFCDC49|nr:MULTISPECIES: D-hexose-6-phosphate mutarotase [Chromohalobacter]MCK2041484.1 D-hexose-6-phosphate mutarotase [Chromohalobacter moromii]MCT8513632.1 D-hexose-6-phosphate mutarotase [Chromohalobacter sp. TMW 2.2271]